MTSTLEQRAREAKCNALNAGDTLLDSELIFEAEIQPTGCNWLTSSEIVESIAERTGRKYHPASARRSQCRLRRKGHLIVERVMPGHKPYGASYPSHFGTTNKRVNHQALGMRQLPRRERARLSADARANSRHRRVREKEMRRREQLRLRREELAATATPPAVCAVSGSTSQLTTELALQYDRDLAMFNGLAAHAVAASVDRELATEEREDAEMLESIQRVRGPP